jgi:hypothetical protein
MTKTTQARLKREEQIKQLQNECKLLLQKERKENNQARTKRLCTRGGAVEKLHPELAAFTEVLYCKGDAKDTPHYNIRNSTVCDTFSGFCVAENSAERS